MGSNMKSIKAGNGLSGSGKGHPPTMGATGPGGSFVGTTTPQDTARKVSGYSSEVSGPSVPRNVGIKNGRTGGRNKKYAGVVGTGKTVGVK